MVSDRTLEPGKCEHCNHTFGYYMIHCGFGDCSYSYCSSCGSTSLLMYWSWERSPATPKMPEGCTPQQEICSEWEPYIESCRCGGSFRKGASPRCPHCGEALSAVIATGYIEKNAVGTAKGWRWQKNWHDTYCMVIENRIVVDNYKAPV